MATLGNKKIFSGTAGNVVYRNLNGRQIVQSRASNVKHSETQKRSASEFGSCSRWAKQLRIALGPLLLGMTDSYMYQRFTATIYSAIKGSELPQGMRTPLNSNMNALEGFEFNSHSPFTDYFKPQFSATLTESNEMIIALTAFDTVDAIVYPPGCGNAKLALHVIATDFGDSTLPLIYHNILAIDGNTSIAAQTVLNTQPLPAGYFVLVTAKLMYFNPNALIETNYLNNKMLSPAMVVMAGVVE
jgi:hypothetical protein